MRSLRYATQGDTLVEVLLAMAILSLMMLGAMTMMSRGLAASQIALEHTQVRNEINTQAELLRYMRDSYVNDPASTPGKEWLKLLTTSTPAPYVDTTPVTYNDTCAPTKRAFYLAQNLAIDNPAKITDFNASLRPTTFATAGRGLWIEAVSSTTPSAANYVDFQIRACWNGAGNASIKQQAGTVVRLYDAQ